MRKVFLFAALLLIYSFSFSQATINCVIKTSLGDIYIELYPKSAPLTVGNFIKYVDNELYNNSSFFRVCTNENEANREIKIEVIQGGNISDKYLMKPIVIETTEQTKLRHQHGTISMARNKPNSAQSSFFICIKNQPELDYNGKRNPDGQGFAAFGKVSNGMDVVLKIQSLENTQQQLNQPVTIETIERVE